MKKTSIVIVDDFGDEEVILTFRAPSPTELVQFRDAALEEEVDLVETIIIGLCKYPSEEEGPDWLKNLSEEDYLKFKAIVEEVSKQIIDRLDEDYSKKFYELEDKMQNNQYVALSCYKALCNYQRTGKPSVKADVAILFLHKVFNHILSLKF